eukprot:323339_1
MFRVVQNNNNNHHTDTYTNSKTQCICNSFINKQCKDIQKHRSICQYSFICCQVCYFICNDRMQLLQHQIKAHNYNGIYDINLNKTNEYKLYKCNYNGCNKSYFELKRFT